MNAFAGFGAADLIEIGVLAFLACLAYAWPRWIEDAAKRFAARTGWCMAALFVLPIALRLALLPEYPIPTPNVADDFTYILSADTLRHWRLANPAHPLPQFFETYFVMMEPAYAAIFPLAQAIIIALGWAAFGNPWAGVAISTGILCALCYWMLRAWTTPGWALVGGAFAVAQFGPLNQWMNSFWGGNAAAIAGCLVFGALPRLGRRRYAVLLGLGIALHFLSRPYESLFLVAAVLAYRVPLRSALIATLAALPALALIAAQNKAVTGSFTTMPYELSRAQYGVPAAFTFQPNPAPGRAMTPQQQLDYEAQSEVHDRAGGFLERLGGRVRYYRFFFLAPLYLALPFFLLRLREPRLAWLAATAALFAVGANFYPYFYSHYVAALTCVFVLMSVMGLARMGRDMARMLVYLCFAHFAFWYGIHLFHSDRATMALWQYETWDSLNHGDPLGREAVNRELAEAPGQHLVFVRYTDQHEFDEWVYNEADIGRARVIWARDLGAENAKLAAYHPGRTLWLLEPDVSPPRLTRAEDQSNSTPR